MYSLKISKVSIKMFKFYFHNSQNSTANLANKSNVCHKLLKKTLDIPKCATLILKGKLYKDQK